MPTPSFFSDWVLPLVLWAQSLSSGTSVPIYSIQVPLNSLDAFEVSLAQSRYFEGSPLDPLSLDSLNPQDRARARVQVFIPCGQGYEVFCRKFAERYERRNFEHTHQGKAVPGLPGAYWVTDKTGENPRRFLLNTNAIHTELTPTLIERRVSSYMGVLPRRYFSRVTFPESGDQKLYYSFSVSEPRFEWSSTDSSEIIRPLLGFMKDTELLNQLASKKGLSIEQWILRVYHPAISSFMTEVFLKEKWVGRNLFNQLEIVLNLKTGAINRFNILDLSRTSIVLPHEAQIGFFTGLINGAWRTNIAGPGQRILQSFMQNLISSFEKQLGRNMPLNLGWERLYRPRPLSEQALDQYFASVAESLLFDAARLNTGASSICQRMLKPSSELQKN